MKPQSDSNVTVDQGGGANTDLQMTNLCAEAMGIKLCGHRYCEDWPHFFDPGLTNVVGSHVRYSPLHVRYSPLHNDAQAMEIVKRFKLQVLPNLAHSGWWIAAPLKNAVGSPDLNRAIVECVAKLHKTGTPSQDRSDARINQIVFVNAVHKLRRGR